jgi:hypothetical protein
MARLTEDQTHYLLYIHASQKERAKAINGRRWDPERLCWMYPKTPSVYREIIAEFGEELIENTATPASASISPKDFHEEINSLKDAVARISSATQSDSELKKLLTQKEVEVIQIREALALANQRIQELEAENNYLQAQVKRGNQLDVNDLLKKIAVEATGSDSLFMRTIDPLPLDTTLPIQLSIQIDQQLKRAMKISDENANFADLISQARDAEILDKPLVDLCHLIRKQRNILVHETVHPKTVTARVILCLFAAALLWPNLPEA